MAAYPRFQKHLFDSQIDKYKERIEAVLGRKGEQIQALNLLPLFVLIQTIELNYKLIDRNQSFYLESDELLLFGKKIEAQLESQIPYLSNQNQERAYLMYSFKTGDIPFLQEIDLHHLNLPIGILTLKVTSLLKFLPVNFISLFLISINFIKNPEMFYE